MFYRVRIDLAYPADTNPKAILAHTKGLMPGAININHGDINQEIGFIILEKCYHDQDPTLPCEVIENYTVPSPQ